MVEHESELLDLLSVAEVSEIVLLECSLELSSSQLILFLISSALFDDILQIILESLTLFNQLELLLKETISVSLKVLNLLFLEFNIRLVGSQIFLSLFNTLFEDIDFCFELLESESGVLNGISEFIIFIVEGVLEFLELLLKL